jgi:hypothetical protein
MSWKGVMARCRGLPGRPLCRIYDETMNAITVSANRSTILMGAPRPDPASRFRIRSREVATLERGNVASAIA